MTSAQVRKSFLDFFREKQHTIVPIMDPKYDPLRSDLRRATVVHRMGLK